MGSLSKDKAFKEDQLKHRHINYHFIRTLRNPAVLSIFSSINIRAEIITPPM